MAQVDSTEVPQAQIPHVLWLRQPDSQDPEKMKISISFECGSCKSICLAMSDMENES